MSPLAKSALAVCVWLLVACAREADPTPTSRHCTEALAPEDCGDLAALLLPAALPEALGNAHADSFDAALLGFRVYFDARFSKTGTVRCESCHSVDTSFADGEPVPVKGLGPGVRNSPTLFNAARHRTIFWDGRVDSLWSQPLLAFENPDEMGTTRLEIVHLLGALYRREYEKAFGPLHDFSDPVRFPPAGKPGDAAYEAMAIADQLELNRVVANLGKALEAYVRKIAAGPSSVDRGLAARLGVDAGYGTDSELSAQQARGLAVFVNAGCRNCHDGPELSDDQLHNLGVPTLPGHPPDEGLSEVASRALAASPFNAAGPFFDGETAREMAVPDPGAFRTPSLRNLSKTSPYGHNGVFATLEEAVDFHLAGGGQDPDTFAGSRDPGMAPHVLSEEDRAALFEFLEGLDGEYPKLPWGQWPNGNG